jgi:hypothetical protein
MKLQVAPKLRSSSYAADASSSYPESCIYGWVDHDFPA